MRFLFVAVFSMTLMSIAQAADPSVSGSACHAVGLDSAYGYSEAEIIARVENNYSVASAVATDQRALHSSRQFFPWALETKFACGRAIGFWQGGVLDTQSVVDCGCFYTQMMMAR